MAFAIRSESLELCYQSGESYVEYGPILYCDTTQSAAALARQLDWGGLSWDIAEVCSLTGALGEWQYFLGRYN
jgi:hypothetical protein